MKKSNTFINLVLLIFGFNIASVIASSKMETRQGEIFLEEGFLNFLAEMSEESGELIDPLDMLEMGEHVETTNPASNKETSLSEEFIKEKPTQEKFLTKSIKPNLGQISSQKTSKKSSDNKEEQNEI